MEYTTGNNPALRLTILGETNYNGVIALFYAGAVKAHLLNVAKSEDAQIAKEAAYVSQSLPAKAVYAIRS
jgi:hypothetical protein